MPTLANAEASPRLTDHKTAPGQDSDSGCSLDMSHSTTITESWVRIHHDQASPTPEIYRIYSPYDGRVQMAPGSFEKEARCEEGHRCRTRCLQENAVHTGRDSAEDRYDGSPCSDAPSPEAPSPETPDPEASVSEEGPAYDSWDRPSHVTGQSRNAWRHLSYPPERPFGKSVESSVGSLSPRPSTSSSPSPSPTSESICLRIAMPSATSTPLVQTASTHSTHNNTNNDQCKPHQHVRCQTTHQEGLVDGGASSVARHIPQNESCSGNHRSTGNVICTKPRDNNVKHKKRKIIYEV